MKKDKDKPKEEKIIEKPKKDTSVIWIFFVMGLIIAVFLIVYFATRGANVFKYEGLTFTKERFGEIPVYHYYYYYQGKDGLIKYNLFLRVDPRKNTVPIKANITYADGKIVYISVNSTGLSQCEDSNLAISNLAAFLLNNEIDVKGATPDKNESESKKTRYATCNTNPGNVVILIEQSNETSISQNNRCYTIKVADCRILEAIEKFQVKSILDAKSNV